MYHRKVCIEGKMQKSNFHTHSVFSDGHNTPREMIEEALSCGFNALGFSDHSYTEAQADSCVTPGTEKIRAEELSSLKKEYADRIKIYDGIELDWHSSLPDADYDYVIGSVHEMYAGNILVEIDNGKDNQQKSIDEIYGGDSVRFAADYFENLTNHIRTNKPDFVGHFDLPTKYSLIDENDPRYIEAAITAARECVKICPTFEVNTGAIARKLRTLPYPAGFIIDEIKKGGGRFIITSDCHYRERMTVGFDVAEKLLTVHGLRKNPDGELNNIVRGIDIWE